MDAVLFVLAYANALWVSLAITIKRLHDQNKPAIRILFYLIPVIGPI